MQNPRAALERIVRHLTSVTCGRPAEFALYFELKVSAATLRRSASLEVRVSTGTFAEYWPVACDET
jgi:hypothetical protein